MFDLLIHNAAQIVTVATGTNGMKRGREMSEIGVIEDGAVGMTNGVISFIGKASDISYTEAARVIDGEGKVVLPGFVDSHTHLVFAGSREDEFVRRNAGATYAEIAAAGGGINSTVKATRAAAKIDLLDLALQRLDS